ncbi:sulfite exporter TauE/SafE family protein [Allokutzneria sp. NRRL B-24872]|uniref:sulfite exporter TauE/SafE family protein n=1 Tax=Allokutzneria sp. NRRL B-24872 TaxID=1137961 RepID=UPI000A38FA0D|nr:sulfite exporter TauE/SafE family protein [Allokutzneria sp. NRRL B-24872]
MTPSSERRRLATIGAAAGTLSGLFGVGGGVVIVPALVAWCGRDQREAVATSLTAVGPLAVAGAIGYALHRQVDLVVALPLGIGSLIGAWLGSALLSRAPLAALRWLYAVIAVGTAVRLWLAPGEVGGAVSHGPGTLALLLPVGIAVGLLSGLTGIGGGTVLVPIMQLGFSLPAAPAKGTSLLVILPTSALGGYQNSKKGNGCLKDSLLVGAAGVLATLVVSQFAVFMDHALSDVLLAFLLLAVGIGAIWGDVRSFFKRPHNK